MRNKVVSISLRSGEGGRAGMHRWRGTILRMFVFRPQNTVRSRRDERRAERGGCGCLCGASRTTSYFPRRSCLSLQLAVRAGFSVRYGMKERGDRPLHPERSGGTGNRIAACRAVGYRMVFSSPDPEGNDADRRCHAAGRGSSRDGRELVCLKKAGRVRIRGRSCPPACDRTGKADSRPYTSWESGRGIISDVSKSPHIRAMSSSVAVMAAGSVSVTSFSRVALKSGSPLK